MNEGPTSSSRRGREKMEPPLTRSRHHGRHPKANHAPARQGRASLKTSRRKTGADAMFDQGQRDSRCNTLPRSFTQREIGGHGNDTTNRGFPCRNSKGRRDDKAPEQGAQRRGGASIFLFGIVPDPTRGGSRRIREENEGPAKQWRPELRTVRRHVQPCATCKTTVNLPAFNGTSIALDPKGPGGLLGAAGHPRARYEQADTTGGPLPSPSWRRNTATALFGTLPARQRADSGDERKSAARMMSYGGAYESQPALTTSGCTTCTPGIPGDLGQAQKQSTRTARDGLPVFL